MIIVLRYPTPENPAFNSTKLTNWIEERHLSATSHGSANEKRGHQLG